nr:MAG TPA: hypothetical protein [Caudoviricetes sp.]
MIHLERRESPDLYCQVARESLVGSRATLIFDQSIRST